ncbi:MAG: hypothetical protein COT85_07615 [Chlamydiae bacterium CG10_big_fil_rev_8_21_14_0_10_42_34]|nr:MAG: hypothetical protein COT85_07615 [Chlamydiae bacterium CG10_big_fil_rev_8_21_14_0_10_42_34]
MEINRKQVVEGFLQNIYRISNKEYQKRIWIEGAGPECHDFDEAVNDFFGDSEPILENYRNYGLSQNQYRILKKFHAEFRIFADEHDIPEEFIDTPEWERIMEMAKEVLKEFGYI